LTRSADASAPRLVFELASSRLLCLYLISLPSLTLLYGLAVEGIAPVWRSLAIACVLLVTLTTGYRHWPGTRGAPRSLVLDGDGQCLIIDGAGRRYHGSIADALVSPVVVVISLRGHRRRRAVVVPMDAMDRESHRQLRGRVRWLCRVGRGASNGLASRQ
jgi:hypothetical protein